MFLTRNNEMESEVNFLKPAISAMLVALTLIVMGTGCTSQCKTATCASPQAMTEAQAQALIDPFYALFNRKGSPEAVRPSFADDWVSYYSNKGARDMDQTLGFVTGPMLQMIPDIT